MFCVNDGREMDLIPTDSSNGTHEKTEAYACPQCHGVQILTPDLTGQRHVLLFANGLEAAGQYPRLFQHALITSQLGSFEVK